MFLRCALALVVCAGCFFKPEPPSGTGSASDDAGLGDGGASDAQPSPWLAGYTRRRLITLNRPASPGGELTNFPASVVLANDSDLMAHPTNIGGLVFTAGDGVSILASEIHEYGSAAGRMEAWVRLPTLPVGLTNIYLYYGGPQRPVSPAQAWSGAYGVWHMDAIQDEADVMGNVGVLTAAGGAYPTRATGVVGSGRNYDGADDALCVDQLNVLNVGSGSFSFSLWIEPGVATGSQESPFWRGGDSNTGAPGFTFELGTGSWEARVSDGLAASLSLGVGSPSMSWTHLAVSVDNVANTVVTYSNGNVATSGSAPFGMFGGVQTFCIGSSQYPYTGTIDEVRVLAVAQPHAWFFVEHLNLATRSNFMTVFDAEVAP